MKDKMQSKLDKHFPVYMNGHKCKILKYTVKDNRLTLVTKIKDSYLEVWGDMGELVIEKDGMKKTYIVGRSYGFRSNTISYYDYDILEEK